jgi:putative transposase
MRCSPNASAIHAESDATYGMPRMRAELADQGCVVSGKRVARLMRAARHARRQPAPRLHVTTQRDDKQRPAPDLVNASSRRRTEPAVGGRHDLRADLGRLHLPGRRAGRLEPARGGMVDRRAHDRRSGACGAEHGAAQRKPRDVIHHSDQGSQYTSIAFGSRCEEMGVRPSMGSVGDAYDNAMAESFFATPRMRAARRRSFKTKTEARTALFTYIEGWYNPRRRHSGAGLPVAGQLREAKHQIDQHSQTSNRRTRVTHRRRLRGRRHAAGGQPCSKDSAR